MDAGLTPERDSMFRLGNEHAQALGVATKGHRRLEFERLAIDASSHQDDGASDAAGASVGTFLVLGLPAL